MFMAVSFFHHGDDLSTACPSGCFGGQIAVPGRYWWRYCGVGNAGVFAPFMGAFQARIIGLR